MKPFLCALLLVALPIAGCLEAVPPAADPAPATGAATPATSRSPYAGNETRDLKALSPQEVADLLAGKGMGYALAAELNSYPGPSHVLDLAAQLGLTDAQRADVEAVRAGMQARAVALGEALVAAEAELDAAFAAGDIGRDALSALTARAAQVEGELRFVHLDAHLATRALLTADQVRAYDALRGYGGGAGAVAEGSDGQEHGSGDHAHERH